MRSLIWRLILASPFLLVLVLFALSNTQTVVIGIWPTDLQVAAPLSIVILVAMAVAFLFGAMATWVVGIAARLRARRAEQVASTLRSELKAVTAGVNRVARIPTTTLLPPARG